MKKITLIPDKPSTVPGCTGSAGEVTESMFSLSQPQVLPCVPKAGQLLSVVSQLSHGPGDEPGNLGKLQEQQVFVLSLSH